MKEYRNIPYFENENMRNQLDVYMPENGDKYPVFVYFHGGGIEEGSKGENVLPFGTLIDHGIGVVKANYSLYPDAKYPSFIEDAAKAVSWVFENIERYGGDPKKIYIGGSSAGAYLTMMLCFDKKYLQQWGVDADFVAGYIFDAGQPTTHFNVLRERGLDTRSVIVDEAAPLYHITERKTLPPMQIFVSENDIEGRLEQTVLLIHTLKMFHIPEHKITYEYMQGYCHCGYINEPVFAEKILNFINQNKAEGEKQS